MYVNKCIKCGAEFETKNPKRVICPNCLYPEKKLASGSDEQSQEKEQQNFEGNQQNGEQQQQQQPQQSQQQFYSSYSAGEDRERPRYDRAQGGYDRNQGGYRDNRGGYDRNQGGYRDNRGGYDRNQGGYNRPQGGYDRNQGGYNRPQGGYDRNQGGYRDNRGGYDRNQGGYNRPQGGYDRNRGGYDRNQGGYNRPQGGGFRDNRGPRPSFNRGGRPSFNRGGNNGKPRQLLISKEQLETIEALYKTMLPLPNPDAHEVIGAKMELEPKKVFFGINLIRQKMMLPKLPYPKRKLAISPDQMFAIRNLYEPLLPLPPIGCHKIIAAQLKMDEWRVHVGIGLIRAQMGLDRWNAERDDVPEEVKKPKGKSPKTLDAETTTTEEPVTAKTEVKTEVETKVEVEGKSRETNSTTTDETTVVETVAEEKPKRGRKPKKLKMQNKYVSVGKILNFHGIQGEAKVGFSKSQEDFIKDLNTVYIRKNDIYEKFIVKKIRFNKQYAIFKFDGINSINDISEYKNSLIFVEENDIREALGEDEFLIDELTGMDAYSETGEKLGIVVGVSNNGATDLLSVKCLSKKISLVPFVKEIVPTVDIKAKKITINNIEGVLE